MFRQAESTQNVWIFTMMWYNVMLSFTFGFRLSFLNIQNQSAAGTVIQLNKKNNKPNQETK